MAAEAEAAWRRRRGGDVATWRRGVVAATWRRGVVAAEATAIQPDVIGSKKPDRWPSVEPRRHHGPELSNDKQLCVSPPPLNGAIAPSVCSLDAMVEDIFSGADGCG